MKRLRGPNWPDWPTASFNERRKRVRVTGTAPTWKSYLKAERDTAIATLTAFGVGCYALANTAAGETPSPDGNIAPAALLTGVVVWVVFARCVLYPHLVNTHHAKTFRLELSPNDIRIHGRRFKRRQKDGYLAADFRIIEDDEAATRLNTKGIANTKNRHRATTSRKVQLILRGLSEPGPLSPAMLGPGKVITLATVLGDEKAEALSVVCQAAEGIAQKLMETE